jgi:putative ABC transport system substrate-binding protein
VELRARASVGAKSTIIVCLTAHLILAFVAVAGAQPVLTVRRVGIFSDAARTGPLGPESLEAFRRGLQEHGWDEGRNVALEFRESRTIEERPEAVAALLRTKPEVIVTSGIGAFVIRPSTPQPVPGWSPVRDIPIVFVGQSDPVGIGLVESLPRPGGSVTGLSYLAVELNSKRLQMLKELVPTLSRVAVLVPSDHWMRGRMVSDIEATARVLGISLQLAEVAATDPVEKIDAAFEAMTRWRAQAVLGLQGPHYYRERKRVCDLALRHHLPGAFELTEYTKAGCLMSYATSLTDLWRRSASYVNRILRGVRAADLPVEQPTKFELVINAKTAKALGITIPPSLLLQMDHVVE